MQNSDSNVIRTTVSWYYPTQEEKDDINTPRVKNCDQWIAILKNEEKIYGAGFIDILRLFLNFPNNKKSCGEIEKEFNINGLELRVVNFGKRVIKFSRIPSERYPASKTKTGYRYRFWNIPFIGDDAQINGKERFTWQLRPELVEALKSLGMNKANIDEIVPNTDDDLTSIVENKTEGQKREIYTTKYERNPRNRDKCIQLKGTACVACGFDFYKVYGERGYRFIEVHHIKPLHTLEEEIIINPATDLEPVCSNCHRMLHRKKDMILTVQELAKIIAENK